MSKKSEAALATFAQGFNCAQSVLSAFCEDYGLPAESAYRVTGGFGSGCRCGEICGAATGGAAVVGLKYAQVLPQDSAAKKLCSEKTEAFVKVFRIKNGAVRCTDLLGYDVFTKEGHAQALAQNLFKTRCAELVESAVLMLEEQGYGN